jgi:ElaB/YqjD/DUF883 family membrane-anchored ribosome-binding protein
MTTETVGSTNGTSTSGQSPERLQQAAGDIAEKAGRTAERQASMTMNRVGDTLDDVARAVRDSGGQLREQRPEIANVADTAAQRVEGVASYLREHDAREVIDQAEQFARRQPALVIGAGLLLGLAAGRLLRSGAEPMSSGTGSAGWTGSTGYGGTTGYSGSTGYTGSSSTASGVTTPGSGYGTGYGASYDTDVLGVPDSTATNLVETDVAAGTEDPSSATGTTGTGTGSTRSKSGRRRSGSTGAE